MKGLSISGLLVPLLFAALPGCTSPDYGSMKHYYETCPKTILVLPARNMTSDAEAPYLFMATIGKPLVDRGYYVMPMHLTSRILAHEGIGLEGESWEIEPLLLHKYLGADAVLYVTIEEWDTHYAVIASSVNVTMHYRLVDARTGVLLWEQRGRSQVQGGAHSGGNLFGLLFDAIDSALTAATTDYVPLASEVNESVLEKLLPGVYHPQYETLQQEIAGWEEAEALRQ